MPLRPIDLQVILPKSIEQHQAKPAVVHLNENALNQVQIENEKRRQAQLKKVNALEQKKLMSAKSTKDKSARQTKPKQIVDKDGHIDITI